MALRKAKRFFPMCGFVAAWCCVFAMACGNSPAQDEVSTAKVGAAGDWDLTPPRKEPEYENEPYYALMVFGPHREKRVWLVLDGETLYVDANGNGDLTEPDESHQPTGSQPFAGAGRSTHFNIYEFTIPVSEERADKFRVDVWVRNPDFVPTTDFYRDLHAKWLELRWENATVYRREGQGRGQTPLLFRRNPEDAQVCALDGPLTFFAKMPDRQVFKRGESESDFALHIAVKGRAPVGWDFPDSQFINPLDTNEVPDDAYLEVQIEFPSANADDPPISSRYQLKKRC